MISTQPNFQRKSTEGAIEYYGSRNGSPLEDVSGLTPTGKTLPNPFPQRRLRSREGTIRTLDTGDAAQYPVFRELILAVVVRAWPPSVVAGWNVSAGYLWGRLCDCMCASYITSLV